ncbi:MAG: hypothetical protein KF785_02095 [Gemmatimonadales bacterium]|nr:hypothetical protein [Gemmatimonadales bacterium]
MDPSRPRGTPKLTSSKSALYEAASAAVADQRNRAADGAGRGPRRGRTALRTALVVLLIAAGTVLALQPVWLVGPGLPEETPAIRTASAELALVDAVARVRSYTAQHGRLPATLDAAGVTNQAIRFTSLGSQDFEVSLPSGDSLIRLRPSSPIESIAAGAIRALQSRQ